MSVSAISSNPKSHAEQKAYNTQVMEQLKTADPEAYSVIMKRLNKGWAKFETVEKELEKAGFQVDLQNKGTRGASWTYESMTIKDKSGNSFKLFDANGDGGFSTKDFNFNSSLSSAVSSIKSSGKTAETANATEAGKTNAISNVTKTEAISNIEKEESADPLNNSATKTNISALQLQLQSYLYDLGYKSSEIETLTNRMVDSGAITEAQSSGASGSDLYSIFNKYIPISTLA